MARRRPLHVHSVHSVHDWYLVLHWRLGEILNHSRQTLFINNLDKLDGNPENAETFFPIRFVCANVGEKFWHPLMELKHGGIDAQK